MNTKQVAYIQKYKRKRDKLFNFIIKNYNQLVRIGKYHEYLLRLEEIDKDLIFLGLINRRNK